MNHIRTLQIGQPYRFLEDILCFAKTEYLVPIPSRNYYQPLRVSGPGNPPTQYRIWPQPYNNSQPPFFLSRTSSGSIPVTGTQAVTHTTDTAHLDSAPVQVNLTHKSFQDPVPMTFSHPKP
jgi:hypothetical protein